MVALLFISQSVESHILFEACSGCCSKGVGLCRLLGHLTPCCADERSLSVNRHIALREFLAVAQDVLTHLTKIDVEVATVISSTAIAVGIDKGVEQPKFHIFNIGGFEIIGIQAAHHASPSLLRIAQVSIGGEVGSEVVGSALFGIISQIEDGQRGCHTTVSALLTVGIEFANID